MASWAVLGNGAALDPAPRGGGRSQTPVLWSANTPGDVSAVLGVFGALCVPKTAARGRTPLPQDTAPHENLLGTP